MKKKWAAVSVVAVVLVGIPPTVRANSADATSAIRENYKEWLAAYDAKNLAGTISIFAENAISTFAGAKDAGIEEIRASYEKSLAANGPKRTWKPVEMEIDGDGDLVYALADCQLIETQPDGLGSVRLTNRSVDVFRRDGETWKIVRSFTIPADKRAVKLSCEIRLPSISPDTFTGAAADVWQTLMRWRESYNRRDLAGTLAPYDSSITGLYAGNTPDDLAKLRDSYTRSFAQNERQRSIDFEPEEILTSGRFAFVRDHWTSTIKTPQGQTQRVSRGIELWQKNAAGEWRLRHYLSYLVCETGAAAAALGKLADDFWVWRAKYAPFTGDDVNRIERPGGIRDWSQASIDQRRKDLEQFEARLKKIDPTAWPISQQVDYKLIGSALSRVRWELDINPRWKRDPNFYIAQTLTALVEALTVPPPYDEARSREILTRVENIPSILQQGAENLDRPPAPFATVAINNLDGIREGLRKMASSLVASTTLNPDKLNSACERAADALEKFQQELKQTLPKLPQQTALGRDAYIWFLRNVALMPFTPEELIAMARQEWNRAVAFETYEKNRNKDVPPLKIADNIDNWIRDAAEKELSIRKFLVERGILSVPDWLQHYTLRPTPEYLRALGFTENDDFTSPSRLKENCIRYVPEPSENLGYFWRATAMDPRPITVHEGIPGHYFQLCLSWKHEDSIRRHYYDSGANEGIGFYAEEMMLQAGLFDDSPHTREIIYNFMRLRALRVEVDVKLALGEFTLDQAAKYLQDKVPMDEQTARQEAIAFSTGPGQAITYQIGKLQITKFLAEARLQQGDKFSLRNFHDFVWKNGNVPIALQRWEYLGTTDEVRK